MTRYTLLEAKSRQQVDLFIKFPWTIYTGDASWCPPMLHDHHKGFDRARNPFFEHSEAVFYLAYKDGCVCGRIAAILNNNHLAVHQDQTGFFGWFECIDDQDVATLLIQEAAHWLAKKGLKRIRGPVNFSMSQECGVLLDDFDQPQVILMGHNPPYYQRLIENTGVKKVHDLFAYYMDLTPPPARLVNISKKIRRRGNVEIRSMDRRRYHQEVDVVFEAQKRAWSSNWGEVPLTYAEFHNAAEEMKVFLDEDLIIMAQLDGKLVGIGALLPDFHQAQKHADGKLNPITALKVLWHKRKIDRFRMFLLGTLEEYRGRGIETVIATELWKRAYEKGYKTCEVSWVLESNTDIINIIKRYGIEQHKTYRLYESDIDTLCRASRPTPLNTMCD